jgi:hypothetical protein
MKRKLWVIVLAVAVAGLMTGCSTCGKKGEDAAPKGFAAGPISADELVATYLNSITKKDPDLLKETLLTEADFSTIQRGKGRQYWQAYFMITKKAFMEKNKQFLGQPLTLTEFKLGREIASKEGVTVYRGTVIRFKTADGVDHETEINFVMEAGGRWKVFGLKYLSDELQRRGVLQDMGVFKGEGKFKGVDSVREMNIKVKKIPKTAAPEGAPETTPTTP